MLCAYCRHENPRSSRFCVGCGAVLVESGKDGRPRRVLRPWGLLRQAPLTVTPSMPDVAEARAAHLGARNAPRGARHIVFASAAAAVVAAVAFAYSGPVPVDAGLTAAASLTHSAPLQASEPVHVLTPTRLAVEVPVSAPPLSEPPPNAQRNERERSRHAAEATRRASADARDDARRMAQRAATEPATYVVAAVERAAVITDGQGVPDAPSAAPETPAPPAPPPVDRWATLRSALASCESEGGVFARATCEERARLENCVHYWGHHALCPVRGSSGQ